MLLPLVMRMFWSLVVEEAAEPVLLVVVAPEVT
jgi:hypothetical protein